MSKFTKLPLPKQIMIYSILLVLIFLISYPFLWMVIGSFKTDQEIYSGSSFLPERPSFDNYINAWGKAPWMIYFKNTIITALIPIAGQILLGSMAAFALTRKFNGTKIIFTFFLGTMMIPAEVTLIPNYVILKNLGMINTYMALIIPFLTGAFSIFIIRQSFLSIPKDYEDAAFIDGCGPFFFLFRLLMPLSKPALVTVALMTFNERWNDYIYPMTMVTKDFMRTVQVGLGVFSNEGWRHWGEHLAASTFITMPMIIMFLFVQKRFIDGIMAGGIKG